MEYTAVEAQVKAILADKLDADISIIKPESRLIDDLGMDSFRSIEMAFELEEKFKIKIPDADIIKVQVVKDIVDYIVERVGKAA